MIGLSVFTEWTDKENNADNMIEYEKPPESNQTKHGGSNRANQRAKVGYRWTGNGE